MGSEMCIRDSFGGCAAASSSESHVATAGPTLEGDWLVKTGCTACHSISVYNLRSVNAMGPDLSIAAEDVPRRFGRSLEDFLREPTGTMALVLAGRIPLDDEERAVAAGKLGVRHEHRIWRRLREAGHRAGRAPCRSGERVHTEHYVAIRKRAP